MFSGLKSTALNVAYENPLKEGIRCGRRHSLITTIIENYFTASKNTMMTR